jgi:pyruvate dehydrogenase E1 component beta subunit
VADAGFDLLDAPIKRVASYDVPMPFAPVLENFVVPSVERIVEAARALVRGKV